MLLIHIIFTLLINTHTSRHLEEEEEQEEEQEESYVYDLSDW